MILSKCRLAAIAVGSLAIAVLATGCFLPLNGGGFVASAGSAGRKAHFGFALTCDSANKLVGTWVYHDKTPGPGFSSVDIGGTMTDETDLGCVTAIQFSGNIPYTVQGPCTVACSGMVDLVVIDGGGIGRNKDDQLGLEVLTGPDAGYSNGPLVDGQPTPLPVLGGNLVVGPAPTSTTIG
jgi:hypothetical protein